MDRMTRTTGRLKRVWDAVRGVRKIIPSQVRSVLSSLSSAAFSLSVGIASAFGLRVKRSVFGQVYSEATWVYVCASANALAASKAPWVMQRREGGDWVTSNEPDHDLQKLLENPHPWLSWSDLVERGILDLQLAGNLLWRLTRENGADEQSRTEGDVLEIWPIWMTTATYPVVNKFSEIEFYHYYDFQTRSAIGTTQSSERSVAAANTVHAMLADPDSIYWGMGRLEAASKAITTDIAASRTQQASMVRGFNPSGVLSLEDQLSDEALDHIKIRFEERHAGPDNAGSLLIVDGTKAKFTPMDPSSAELGYFQTREMTRDETLSIFGTPGPVVGVLDRATYNNATAMYQQWWLATLTPLLGIVQRAVNHQLVTPNFGPDVRLVVDTTKIPELLPAIKSTSAIGLDLQKLGYSTDQINERLALGMPKLDEEQDT
jgi:HK97 family phage portal protein